MSEVGMGKCIFRLNSGMYTFEIPFPVYVTELEVGREYLNPPRPSKISTRTALQSSPPKMSTRPATRRPNFNPRTWARVPALQRISNRPAQLPTLIYVIPLMQYHIMWKCRDPVWRSRLCVPGTPHGKSWLSIGDERTLPRHWHLLALHIYTKFTRCCICELEKFRLRRSQKHLIYQRYLQFS